VLIDAEYKPRLVDFGYSSLIGNIPEALSYLQRSTTRSGGALRWIAPEQVDPEDSFTHTTRSDIYSFGCIALQASSFGSKASPLLITALQVLSGKQPWSEFRQDCAVVLQLARGQRPGRPPSRVIEDSHWDFIQYCWSPEAERPTTGTIISTIKQFLSSYPLSHSLYDRGVFNSSHTVVDQSSSTPSRATSGFAVITDRYVVVCMFLCCSR
jgi:serine/threonine protein kinase